MALVTAGPLIGEIRGSMGGTTFSRNRYGMYTRTRAVPVNPNTQRQIDARARFNYLSTYWRDTLTKVQRDGWDLYATNTNWINAVGQVVHLTGLNHFLRSNNFRMVAGKTPVDAAPITFGIPPQEELWSHAADATLQQITVTYTFPVNLTDQDYFFYQGKPVDGSRTFFAGPWRLAVTVFGDTGDGPVSPKVSASSYVIGAGQNCYLYCRRLDADARLTEPFRHVATVT